MFEALMRITKWNNLLEMGQKKLSNSSSAMYSMRVDGKFYIIPLDIMPNEFILRYFFYYSTFLVKVGSSLPKERAAENGRR